MLKYFERVGVIGLRISYGLTRGGCVKLSNVGYLEHVGPGWELYGENPE